MSSAAPHAPVPSNWAHKRKSQLVIQEQRVIIGVRLRPPFPEKAPGSEVNQRRRSLSEADKDQNLVSVDPNIRRSSVGRASVLEQIVHRQSVGRASVVEQLVHRGSVKENISEPTSKPAFSCVRIKHPGTVVLLEPPAADDGPSNRPGTSKSSKARHRVFKCDHVFDSSDPECPEYADQKKVYDVVGAPLVEKAMQGFNCCFIAYGQTGAGKTHTVVGDWQYDMHRGLLPRIAQEFFERIKEEERSGAEVRVRISYLEIYNGQLRDLLVPPTSKSPAPGQAAPALTVHAHPRLGIYVENLSSPAVHNFEDIRELATYGAKAQHVNATSMNARSSRSHTVFTVKFEVSGDDNAQRMASIQVVDLAGRENEATSETTGERLKELTYINRSLFQLANCVHALGRRSNEHVPFRNSKLTMILSESLRHNSLTTILAMLTPSPSCYEENLLTCRFLDSAGKIETKPEANNFGTQKLLMELRAQIEELQTPRLDRRASQIKENERQLRSKRALYTFVSQDGWDEALAQSAELVRANRQAMLESIGVPRSLLEDTAVIERARHAKSHLDNADAAMDRIDAGNVALKEILGVMDDRVHRIESAVREMQGLAPLPKAKRVNLVPQPEKSTVSLPPIRHAEPREEHFEAQHEAAPAESGGNRPRVSVTVSLPPIIFH